MQDLLLPFLIKDMPRALLLAAAAFVLTLISGGFWIRLLRAKKIGKQIRAEGPESHLVKTGTPTMGGIIISSTGSRYRTFVLISMSVNRDRLDRTTISTSKHRSFAMSTPRFILAALLLVGSLLLSSGGAAAKEGNPHTGPNQPQRARITWSIPRLEQTVSPGQTVEVTATLTSSADLNNLTLRVPNGLGRVVTVEPATIASLKAGVATPVKLTIAMPATGAHSQGGVLQVRAGQRSVPSALKIKLTVPGATEDAEDSD